MKYHKDEIIRILQDDDEDQHYSVIINFSNLCDDHVEVTESLLMTSIRLLKVLDNALATVAAKLYDDLKTELCSQLGKTAFSLQYSLKKNMHTRFSVLPSCPGLYRLTVPRTSDANRLLCVNGTVVRTTSSKMLEYKKEYICTKCKHVFMVEVSLNDD